MQLFHLWTHGQLHCALNMMRAHTLVDCPVRLMVKPFSGPYKHTYVQHTHTFAYCMCSCLCVYEKNVLYTICVFEFVFFRLHDGKAGGMKEPRFIR